MTKVELAEQLKKAFGEGEARGWIHGPRSFTWFLWTGGSLEYKEEPDYAALDDIRAFNGSKEVRWFGGEFLEVAPDPQGLTQRAILFGKITKTEGEWSELDELRIGRHWVPVKASEDHRVRLVLKETVSATENGTRVTDEVIVGLECFDPKKDFESLFTER